MHNFNLAKLLPPSAVSLLGPCSQGTCLHRRIRGSPMSPNRFTQNIAICSASFALLLVFPGRTVLHAQTAATGAPAAASTRQLGTVKSISGNTVTISTTAGAPYTITVAPNAPVLQLPPGSTDLKSATPTTLDNIAVGDRVLATGKPGDTPDAILASRVILMKSSDLAARAQEQQADWQRHGVSGLVKSTDGQVLTISAGPRTVTVQTTPTTVFRRYAADSISFQDAKPGTLDQIHTGDQLSVRGTHSDDNLSITAEEVVTGTFANLSGVVSTVDPASGTVSLKDLATKKPVTVKVTANSDLRKLPAQAAAAFAARNTPGAAASAGAVSPEARASAGGGAGGQAGPGAQGGGRARAGMDLSRMLARLPAEPLADLKTGDAVMIVASPSPGASNTYTAITLLSGVEPLLSSTAPGAQPITLSPWNLSAPEGGGGGPSGPQ